MNTQLLLGSKSRTNSWKPTVEECRFFKGNFCGAEVDFELPFTPGGFLYTPAYVVYDTATRIKIRKFYKTNLGTHFPINLNNHEPLYHSFYPQWDDDDIELFLCELLQDHLIPVGFVMRDNEREVSVKCNPELVPIVVHKWEDAFPLKTLSSDEDNLFLKVRKYFPKSLLYWHNPVENSVAIGGPFLPEPAPPEGAVWNYMVQECKVQGLLYQGNLWENVSANIDRLDDFIPRLRQGKNGWPIADIILYETVAFARFNGLITSTQASELNKAVYIARGQYLHGYCNGI